MKGTIKEEQVIVNIVQLIRHELQKIETINSFEFEIKASGRVHEGDVKITFCLDSSYDSYVSCKGNSIAAVLQEFMRRFGWNARHSPLLITAGESLTEEAEQVISEVAETNVGSVN